MCINDKNIDCQYKRGGNTMITLREGGAYLVDAMEVIPAGPEAVSAI